MSKVDYASLEKRVLAEYQEAYPGFTPVKSHLLDIHTITSAVVLGTLYSSITKPQRNNVGKSLNFSMLYTPGAMWEVPSEKDLMSIWTYEECQQLRDDLGIDPTKDLYQALTTHFTSCYGGKK